MQLNHRSEYGKCEDCQQDNTGPQWCNTCNSKRFQSEFNEWTSEDAEIDEFIQKTQLTATKYEEVIEWIPFDRFDNIKYLDEGGFGKVFRAACEYGKCEDCQQDNTGPQWCNTCNSKRFQSEFNEWTSEDAEIDEFIQKTQLTATKYEEVIEWIPFDRFDNIKYLDEGGFGKVFRAAWSDRYIISWDSQDKIWKRSQQNVCSKSLNTTNKDGFLQEIKYQLKF
ncbi:hypothetical protein Glove_136g21 [Diversispora epigaea]|uniref:Protein kinase domain-containing protein n=1 Tax=Diversispora epigaea TaxID=1348612 RepID=A0A397J6K1_9GLOM|nr:hypothetical protein Glove_136g21 [Diversispora epigaea]